MHITNPIILLSSYYNQNVLINYIYTRNEFIANDWFVHYNELIFVTFYF